MAQRGTAELFLSGTHKTRVYPELLPRARVPRAPQAPADVPFAPRESQAPSLSAGSG